MSSRSSARLAGCAKLGKRDGDRAQQQHDEESKREVASGGGIVRHSNHASLAACTTLSAVAWLRSSSAANPAAAHDEHAIRHAEDFRQFGRDHHHGVTPLSELAGNAHARRISRRRRYPWWVHRGSAPAATRASHFASTTFCWLPPDKSLTFCWEPNALMLISRSTRSPVATRVRDCKSRVGASVGKIRQHKHSRQW